MKKDEEMMSEHHKIKTSHTSKNEQQPRDIKLRTIATCTLRAPQVYYFITFSLSFHLPCPSLSSNHFANLPRSFPPKGFTHAVLSA